VLYFIGPTVWAWRKKRLKTIKKNVSKMLLIFPFEEELYRSRQIPAAYVGHPLNEMITLSLSREEFFEKFGLDPDKKLITLLPGSRRGEIKFHLPILLQAVKRLREEVNVQFLLLQAEHLDDHAYSDPLSSSPESLKMIQEYKYEAMASSDLVLAACGTANLEAVLLDVPLVSFYRIWPFYYMAGVKFVKIRNYSIANILAGKSIVPELIQTDFTAENLIREARRILDSDRVREEMVRHFKDIKKSLGNQSAFLNVADELGKIVFPD
jgi:lipid-A-disaccharide synthase